MQYMNIIFVGNEELKGGMQGYLLCLLRNQLKFNCSCSGVNERTHLLRKNYSRNFSSIRSGPITLVNTQYDMYIHVLMDLMVKCTLTFSH